jgi:hypothetical protein
MIGSKLNAVQPTPANPNESPDGVEARLLMLLGRMDSHRNDLDEVRSRICVKANLLVGAAPVESGDNKAESAPKCLLDALHMECDKIMDLTRHLRDEIKRLGF